MELHMDASHVPVRSIPPGRMAINLASREELATLPGVDDWLAGRILADREANGPFKDPRDLTRVIPPGTVVHVMPYVDLSLPDDASADDDEGSWIAVIVWCVLGAGALAFTIWNVSGGLEVLTPTTGEEHAVGLWIELSVALVAFAGIVGCFAAAIKAAVPEGRAGFLKWPHRFVIATIAVGLLSAGLANFVYYQRYAPRGWDDLAANPAALCGLAWGISFFLFVLAPIALVNKYPRLLVNEPFQVVVDVGTVITSAVVVVSLWFASVPTWYYPIGILLALVQVGVGLLIVARQVRALDLITEMWVLDARDRESRDLAWVTWLNSHVPNPEEQKRLLETLLRQHPETHRRSLLGYIVATLGVAAVGGGVKGLIAAVF